MVFIKVVLFEWGRKICEVGLRENRKIVVRDEYR